jgi:hypothetical protein
LREIGGCQFYGQPSQLIVPSHTIKIVDDGV